MSLDEQTKAFIARATANPSQPPGSVPLPEFRQAVEAFRPLGFDPVALAEVRAVIIPGPRGSQVAARLYRPISDVPSPVVVWAHGGSWVRVTVDLLDGYFRFIAARSGCAVLAVDYGLAPESQFPSAINEIYTALRWVRRCGDLLGCDPSRVAVAGESSGGNLAAAVALLARDRGEPLVDHQLLLVPVLDALFESASWRTLGNDYLLTREQLTWAVGQYAPDSDLHNPLISPLRADSLAGLPPATIVVGEFDPLRDEGLAYAERLREAGVEVCTIDVEGLIHHAILAPKAMPRGHEAVTEAADALAATLRPHTTPTPT